MKVVLCGAGSLGSSLIHFLSLNYEMIIIDSDAKVLENIGLHYDVQTLCGSASDPHILNEINWNPSTHVLGLTASNDVNLVACHLSRCFGPVATTIARLENPGYFKNSFSDVLAQKFSLDFIFSSDYFVTETIMNALEYPGSFDALALEKGGLILLGLGLASQHPWVGKSIKNIEQSYPNIKIVRLMRKNQQKKNRIYGKSNSDRCALSKSYEHCVWIPDASDILCAKDALYLMVQSDHLKELYVLWEIDLCGTQGSEKKLWARPEPRIKSIVLLGSSPVSFALLPQLLIKGHTVSLLSNNETDLLRISQEYPVVQLTQGCILDPMCIQNIVHSQCTTISMDRNDTTNLLSAVMAQSAGVSGAMACVKNLKYASPFTGSNLQTIIHPASRIFSTIVQKITQCCDHRVYPLQGLGSGTLVQAIVYPGAKIVGTSRTDWEDDRWRILGVYRGKEWLWSWDQIMEGDNLVATALPNGYDALMGVLFVPPTHRAN